jgi:hypothetical protein
VAVRNNFEKIVAAFFFGVALEHRSAVLMPAVIVGSLLLVDLCRLLDPYYYS